MSVINVGAATTGICEWLADNGFGTHKSRGAYKDGDRAITVRRLPAHPDTALAVTPYGVVDAAADLTDSTLMLQLRYRTPAGDMTAVDEWADQVGAALHLKQHVALPNGLIIQRARRTIVAPFGPDENGRPERADSYQILFMLPQ